MIAAIGALFGLLFVIWAAAAQNVAHATFVCGTADTVEFYNAPGVVIDPDKPDNLNNDPTEAIGPRDDSFVSLGAGGTIILHIAEGIIVNPGPDWNLDFGLIEIGSAEGVFVEVSENGVDFFPVDGGAVAYGSAAFDLQGIGLTIVHYVRLTDDNVDNDDPDGSGSLGYDLDAIEVFSCPEPGSNPAIDIEKATNGHDADSPTGPFISVGGAVNWTYVVTNTGDIDLVNVAVTDDQGVAVSCPQNTLAIAEVMVCTANGVATAGQYANIGSVTGDADEPGGQTVDDSDPSHYFGETPTNPAIDIEKATNGDDADNPTGPIIPAGDPVLWTYVVTNTGDVDLDNIVVTDNQGVAVSCPLDALSPGESMECTANGIATADQYANIGSVTGDSPDDEQVEDEDPSHYYGDAPSNPAIVIEKYTLVIELASDNLCDDFGRPSILTMIYTGDGDDATSHNQDPTKVSVVGDPNDEPIVRILVGNKADTGDSKFKTYLDENVALGDPFVIDAAAVSRDRLDANMYVFIYDLDDVLLQTVNFHASCSQPLAYGDQWGAAKFDGFIDEFGAATVAPDGPVGLGDDADEPTGPLALVGDDILWTYVVTNIGDVTLTDVVVTDDQGVAVTCPKDTLAPGEEMNCTANGTAVAGQYANIGTVVGTAPDASEVTDNDPSHYLVLIPSTNLCDDFGKPKVLTLLYTGDGDDATSHSQDPSKVSVVGDPNDEALVRIVLASKDNLDDGKTRVYFDDQVALGDTFVVDAGDLNRDSLDSNSWVFVYDLDGNLLQLVNFHTSCSQPLFLSDQFGSIQLISFADKDGGGGSL